MTPFVLIGAYQRLLDHFQRRPQRQDDSEHDKLARHNITNAHIRFSWFQQAADKIAHIHGESYKFSKPKAPNTPFTYCKDLIIREMMAMYAKSLIAPYLPPHAWSLNYTPGKVPGIKEVEALGRNVDYDTGRFFFMFWDLVVDGEVIFQENHIKIIANMMTPYVPTWWVNSLFAIYSLNKKKRERH